MTLPCVNSKLAARTQTGRSGGVESEAGVAQAVSTAVIGRMMDLHPKDVHVLIARTVAKPSVAKRGFADVVKLRT